MKIKILIVLISILLVSENIYAQNAQSFIAGQIIDEKTQEPIELATVVLYKVGNLDPMLGGTSNEQGKFFFKDIKEGTYILKVQYVGYDLAEVNDITIDKQNPNKRLGTIRLRNGSQNLDEVEVTAQKDIVQTNLGSRVYNVAQDLTVQGGSAIDVLQNIPSVQVDENGGVSLRGSSNLTVLVNGRQSGMTGANRQAVFERIPANMIEKIEVMNNPSAKYDAEGGAGIINIILKKKQDEGWSLVLDGRVGNLNRHNASANFNLRKSKYNFFGSLNFNQRTRIGTSDIDRENFENVLLDENNNITGEIPQFINQINDRDGMRQSYTSNLGLDLYLNDKNTLTIEGSFGYDPRERTVKLDTENIYELGDSITRNLRFTDEYEDEFNQNFSLNYEKTFAKQGKKLNVSFNYTKEYEDERENYEDTEFFADNSSQNLLQRTIASENSTIAIGQIDFTNPIRKNIKFETGAKSLYRNIDNNFRFEDYNNESSLWVNNEGFTNRFDYTEQVHAAYTILGGKFGNLEVETGLRAELTLTESTLITTNEVFENDYFNLFPSGVVAYDLGKSNKIQATFTRRINRPSTRSLNPFRSFSNNLTQRQGNPFLFPEFTNAYELEYLKDWSKGSLTTAVFYRETTDVIQYFNPTRDPENPNILILSPQNIGISSRTGVEVIGTWRPTSWFFLNGNVSYFYFQIDGQNQDEAVDNSSSSWTARLMARFSLPKGWNIQMNGFYRAPIATAQGERLGMLFNSVAISKKVLQGKGTINLQVRDVAQTMQFGGTTRTETIFNSYKYTGKTRTIRLGFNYRFGNLNKKNMRRNRSGGGRPDDMDGGM